MLAKLKILDPATGPQVIHASTQGWGILALYAQLADAYRFLWWIEVNPLSMPEAYPDTPPSVRTLNSSQS